MSEHKRFIGFTEEMNIVEVSMVPEIAIRELEKLESKKTLTEDTRQFAKVTLERLRNQLNHMGHS